MINIGIISAKKKLRIVFKLVPYGRSKEYRSYYYWTSRYGSSSVLNHVVCPDSLAMYDPVFFII